MPHLILSYFPLCTISRCHTLRFKGGGSSHHLPPPPNYLYTPLLITTSRVCTFGGVVEVVSIILLRAAVHVRHTDEKHNQEKPRSNKDARVWTPKTPIHIRKFLLYSTSMDSKVRECLVCGPTYTSALPVFSQFFHVSNVNKRPPPAMLCSLPVSFFYFTDHTCRTLLIYISCSSNVILIYCFFSLCIIVSR